MSTDSLRDLLHERVADETTIDLSARAWRAGRRARHRRSLSVVGGVTAGVVAASGAIAWVGSTPPPPESDGIAPATGAPSVTESAVQPGPTGSGAVAGPSYQGVDTWWFGDAATEADLPQLDGTGLPRTIDLRGVGEPVAGTGPVVALLGVLPDGPLDRAVAVGSDGVTRSLDVSRLAPVADEQGNTYAPLLDESLAPDGSRAFFVQERSLEVYEFATGTWTTVATPPYLAEGARWTTSTEIWVPDRLGGTGRGTDHDLATGRQTPAFVRTTTGPVLPGSEPFGPLVGTATDLAQAVFLSEPATGPDQTSYGGLDAVAATLRGRTSLLVLDARGSRWKGCCPVVGVLDATVLLESRSERPMVLAWDVGTERVRRVSEITGLRAGQESYVASWRVPRG